MNKINKSPLHRVYAIILNLIFFQMIGNVYAGGIALDSAAAKSLLLKASKYYSSSSGLEIEFESRVYWSALEEWHQSKGTLKCNPNNEYRLILPELVMVSNGKTLWKYSLENKQVVIEDISQAVNTNHPAKLIFDFLTCRPLSMKEVKQDKHSFYQISLEPGSQFPQYDSITVYLQKLDSRPYKVETVDENENRNIYTITKIKKDAVFKEKTFMFIPPDGIEVVDLRD